MADLGGADITKYRERQLLDTEYIRNPSVLQLDEDDEYDSDSDDGVVYSHGRAPDLIDEHNDFFFLEKLPGRPGRLYRLREPELLETLLPTSRAVYERQRVSAHAVRTWFMNPNTTRQFLNREVDMEATPLHALVAATGPFPSKEDHLCKICRETHLAKSLAAKLTCGHQFDAECLSGWFRYSPEPTCPTCRWDSRQKHSDPWVAKESRPLRQETSSTPTSVSGSTSKPRLLPHQMKIRPSRADPRSSTDPAPASLSDTVPLLPHQMKVNPYRTKPPQSSTDSAPASLSDAVPAAAPRLLPHQMRVNPCRTKPRSSADPPSTSLSSPAAASEPRLLPHQMKVNPCRTKVSHEN